MLRLEVTMCNCEYSGTYTYDNVSGMTTENGVCHISMGKKQIIIPLDKIVKIELEEVSD